MSFPGLHAEPSDFSRGEAVLRPFGGYTQPSFDVDGFEDSADGLAIELPPLRPSPAVQALVVLSQQSLWVCHFRHPQVGAEQDGLSEVVQQGGGVGVGFREQPGRIGERRLASDVQADADDGR